MNRIQRASLLIMLVCATVLASTVYNQYGAHADQDSQKLAPYGDEGDATIIAAYYRNGEYQFKMITDTKTPLDIAFIDVSNNILFEGRVESGEVFIFTPPNRGVIGLRITNTVDEDVNVNLSYSLLNEMDNDVRAEYGILLAIALFIMFLDIILVRNRSKKKQITR
ncbi:MAG TPA: hypothetical protein PK718_04605 [Candidatus Methanofastidiosa archaeon]|nr:hypothetical protein [Candidatus Methanofastidiosa archaeon]